MTLNEYVNQALASFESDPADTPFQRGYKAAFEELRKAIDDGEIQG